MSDEPDIHEPEHDHLLDNDDDLDDLFDDEPDDEAGGDWDRGRGRRLDSPR
ncbi:hypothetical protein D9M73_291550 [compost metagenome]